MLCHKVIPSTHVITVFLAAQAASKVLVPLTNVHMLWVEQGKEVLAN